MLKQKRRICIFLSLLSSSLSWSPLPFYSIKDECCVRSSTNIASATIPGVHTSGSRYIAHIHSLFSFYFYDGILHIFHSGFSSLSFSFGILMLYRSFFFISTVPDLFRPVFHFRNIFSCCVCVCVSVQTFNIYVSFEMLI